MAKTIITVKLRVLKCRLLKRMIFQISCLNMSHMRKLKIGEKGIKIKNERTRK